MVALGLCGGCEDGNHAAHVYWIVKPPKGVLGGYACGCTGDCADRPKPRYWFDEALDNLVSHGSIEEESMSPAWWENR